MNLLKQACWVGCLSLLMLFYTQIANAGKLDRLLKLDGELGAFKSEIGNQQHVINRMQQVLNHSYRTNAIPDIRQLHAMGLAGIGVVGAGRRKPQRVQKIIKEYESGLNPQNIMALTRLYGLISKEKKQAEEKLGLQRFPPDYIHRLASGRAYYKNEIVRSREIIARFNREVRKINWERSEIWRRMNNSEKQKYRNIKAGNGSRGGSSRAQAGGKPYGSFCKGHHIYCKEVFKHQVYSYVREALDRDENGYCDICGKRYSHNGRFAPGLKGALVGNSYICKPQPW